jgi:spore coat protein H
MYRLYRWAAGALVAVLLVGGMLISGFDPPQHQAPAPAPITGWVKDQVLPVQIELSEADYEHLMANGTLEQEYPAAVTWNGETLPQISVRAKGNSSLNSVSRSENKRYSLKLDLNQYIDGQSVDGITTINLNNSFSDPSFLREYLSYEAFASLGVPAPTTTWVELTVNGKLWGLYLAVEQIGRPFLQRNFADATGALYKPDGEKSGAGADLKWRDDSFASYPGIVYKSGEVSGDHAELIAMLDALNNGGDLEKHLDVDEILRYFAASTVMSNFDSYQGTILHNYYLYEENGRFTILPWDLNMSFAGFGMGGGTEAQIAVKIDEPTMTALAERPLIAKLLEVPEYVERYHGYVKELVQGYLDPATFEARALEVQSLLDPYVQRDPTKFVTYEQFKASLEGGAVADPAQGQNRMQGGMMGGNAIGLVTFVEQRVANVLQQLDGTLPTKGDGSGMGATTRGAFRPGQAGAAPGQGRVRPQGAQGQFQPPGDGAQVPQGPFQPPGDGAPVPQGPFQPPGDGAQVPQGPFQPPGDGAQGPQGRFGARPGFPGAEAPGTTSSVSALGLPVDQAVPVGVAVLLLVAATGVIWRLRPR